MLFGECIPLCCCLRDPVRHLHITTLSPLAESLHPAFLSLISIVSATTFAHAFPVSKMHSSILFTLATGLAVARAQAPVPVPGVTGQLGDAAIVEGNPAGVSYVATLPNSDTTDIRGSVVGTSNANGTGVNFQVSLSGLPDASLGPFCKFSQSALDGKIRNSRREIARTEHLLTRVS